jgi:hypothetical protein
MVAAVVNANTAFFMSEASSRFSRNFNRQSGHSFPRPPFAKGLP